MEKAKVYFSDLRALPGTSLPEKLKKLIRRAGIGEIDFEKKMTAIKIHFGEPGNLSYLRPNWAKAVADVVKELGGRPFLTDCNTLYVGRRKDVRKIYKMGEVEIRAVDGIDFEIEKGEFAVIVGPSGAGKTTVLNILGGMDTATSGLVQIDGTDITRFKARQLTSYRRDDIGFVFQFYNLIQNLTALENVELALQICKDPLDAEIVLKEVGLGDRMKNFPAQLSGGEQQRVSIARALAKNPKILLCDEPTGALDYNTGKAILKLLQDTCREKGVTVILITHNSAIAPMADRVIHIKNGKVSKILKNDHPVPVETIEW